MLKFEPLSAEQAKVKQNLLLDPGSYQVVIKTAEQTVSKKGNPMIKMLVVAYDKEGREKMLFDYLMESIPAKLRNFCYAAGIGDKYDLGTIEDKQLIGLTAMAKVVIEEDKNGQFPPQNRILDYFSADKPVSSKKKTFTEAEVAADFDNDIPF